MGTIDVGVTAVLELHADEPGTIAVQIAPMSPSAESLTAVGSDASIDELVVEGARVHVVRLPAGDLTITYQGTIERPEAPASPLTPEEAIRWRRQSRYCPSDRLEQYVVTHLADELAAEDPAAAIGGWVHEHLTYRAGTSDASTDALDTLLAGAGVCRDFAHVTIALSRAAGLPARFAAVYAPALAPMDFHAVAEVGIGGRWELVDATRLAPRASMVRIATGRDAADTALVTTLDGHVDLVSSTVTAVTTGDVGPDDPGVRMSLP